MIFFMSEVSFGSFFMVGYNIHKLVLITYFYKHLINSYSIFKISHFYIGHLWTINLLFVVTVLKAE